MPHEQIFRFMLGWLLMLSLACLYLFAYHLHKADTQWLGYGLKGITFLFAAHYIEGE